MSGGNASAHSTRDLPVIVAGGGFKHGQHLAFDQQNNYPLTNLFVSMLQRLGIETGIDLEKLAECGRLAEDVVGQPLPGSVMKGGTLRALRAKVAEAAKA